MTPLMQRNEIAHDKPPFCRGRVRQGTCAPSSPLCLLTTAVYRSGATSEEESFSGRSQSCAGNSSAVNPHDERTAGLTVCRGTFVQHNSCGNHIPNAAAISAPARTSAAPINTSLPRFSRYVIQSSQGLLAPRFRQDQRVDYRSVPFPGQGVGGTEGTRNGQVVSNGRHRHQLEKKARPTSFIPTSHARSFGSLSARELLPGPYSIPGPGRLCLLRGQEEIGNHVAKAQANLIRPRSSKSSASSEGGW